MLYQQKIRNDILQQKLEQLISNWKKNHHKEAEKARNDGKALAHKIFEIDENI